MIEMQGVRNAIAKRFDRVRDLGDGLLRGDRIYGGKPFAVAYFDLTDSIVERADTLAEFQERLLGSDFFSTESGDLRWNSYLYFLAGPHSRGDDRFREAKSLIESNRNYARKFVVTEQDLIQRLGVSSGVDAANSLRKDIDVVWADLLRGASLGVVLEQRPRTRLLEAISTGKAFEEQDPKVPQAVRSHDDPLSNGFIRSLSVKSFRAVNSGRDFSFGDVTLVFGSNGTGKTSLLEALEALYCGHVRRDPDAEFDGLKAIVKRPTGELVEVAATRAAATIKARNQAWYRRSDQLSSAISQGFSRFNFLDTDAAFRLSTAERKEDISEDLSRLLVGPDASQLWGYLYKLHDEVEAKLRELDARLPSVRKQAELLAEEVKRLADSPSEANTLLATYRSRLTSIGAKWAHKEMLSDGDRKRLDAVSRDLSQLLMLSRVSPCTVETIRQQASEVERVSLAVTELVEEEKRIRSEVSLLDKELIASASSLSLLETWARYCDAEIPQLRRDLNALRERLAHDREMLGAAIVSDTFPDLPIMSSALTLDEALEVARSDLRVAEEQESDALQALKRSEEIGSSIAALRSDLHSIAKALLEKTGDSSHCPVCGVLHNPESLSERVDGLLQSEHGEVSGGLRYALQLAKERAVALRMSVGALDYLKMYADRASKPSDVSVASIFGEVKDVQGSVRKNTEAHQSLEGRLSSLGSIGIDVSGFDALQAEIKRLMAGAEDLTSAVAIAAARRKASAKRDLANNKKSELGRKLGDLNGRAAMLLASLGLQSEAGSEVSAASAQVERRKDQFALMRELLSDITSLITMDENSSIDKRLSEVNEVVSLFDRAIHAQSSEHSAKALIESKKSELDGALAKFRADTSARSRFGAAQAVLSTITESYSLASATSEVLGSIRERVDKIFARIHSPAEYRLGSFEGETPLVELATGSQRRIDQVSTGQRAALALSMFLSLNESATTAPPVVMIDDPVAHVDDLNTLSFLDYLRDVAIAGSRQVFFTTADARLAALFERKFEFMGDRFKKIVLQKR